MIKAFTHTLKRLVNSGWRYAFVASIVLMVGIYAYAGRDSAQGATFVIQPGDFMEQVSVSGTVTAAQDVALGFAANGRIAGVYARVGQQVAAGTVLAHIENADLSATLSQKNAELASLVAGARPERLAVAEAEVASAAATLMDAIRNAYTVSDDAVRNRADSLFTNPRTNPKLSFIVTNFSSQSRAEHDRLLAEISLVTWAKLVNTLTVERVADSAGQAKTYLTEIGTLLAHTNEALNQGVPDQTTTTATLATYNTTLATARTNVSAAMTTLTSAMGALTDAQKSLILEQAGPTAADIASLTAEVENARANLAKTRVVAPFNGIVTRMDAKVGEIVSPNTSGISLQSDGLFHIETYIPEVAIARVTKGNPATTTLDAYGSGVSFPSVVIAVDPAETVKDGVPTYKTTLAFLAADPRIRSGMTANVIIQTGLLRSAVVIPSGAVTTRAGAQYVSVIRNGVIEERTVVTGPSPALGQTHILSGVSGGEVILLTPTP